MDMCVWKILMSLIISVSLSQLGTAVSGGTDCMRCDSLQFEIDELKQEMEMLKHELHHWQNSTLSILKKYTLDESGCSGQNLREDVQMIYQDISDIKSSYLDGIKTFQSTIEKYETFMATLQNSSDPASFIAKYTTKLEEITEKLMIHSHNGTFHSPAVSCEHLKADHPASPSGEYWIQNPESGYASHHYCDMDRADCGGARGWMRITYLDMDNPSHHCPSGFREITSPVRACGRPSGTTCASVTFSTHGIRYRRVIGKVIGYQDKSPNAFNSYFYTRTITLEGAYVDGVSITYGQPRKHIWTFAAAVDENRANDETCPCTISGATYTGVIPPFIGNDYFCETGSRYAVQYIFYDEDPLWDKEGCGGGSRCCNGSPFFCKELPHTHNEDIELRFCCNGDSLSDEDVPIKHIELYVQ